MTTPQTRPALTRGAGVFHLFGAAAAGLCLAACQSIPDISIWNTATKDVASAVAEGFDSAASVNTSIAGQLEATGQAEDYQHVVKRYREIGEALDQRANDYEQVFGAIADYSSSLAAIAQAAESSQETVTAVAGSLNALVESVGGTKLTGAGFELGKALANEVIKIKAARDFSEAVEKADPVIGELAELLEKDLESLANTVGTTKIEAIRAAITIPYQKQMEYREALLRRRSELQTAIEGKVWPRSDDPDTPRGATKSVMEVGEASELSTVERYLREADAWYGPMRDQLDRALETRATTERLAAETRAAVTAWRESHASLVTATRERRLPESGRLAVLAVRIRDLVSEINEKKEN